MRQSPSAVALWAPAWGPPLSVSSIHPKGHAAFGWGRPPWLRKVSGPHLSVGVAEAGSTRHGTLLTFSGRAWKGASQSPGPGQPGAPWRPGFFPPGSVPGSVALPLSGFCSCHPSLACYLWAREGSLGVGVPFLPGSTLFRDR